MIMKLRSKLLMAAVSLLTVSVAATATSAYAWYAANRQTNASLTNVEVRSTETSIQVSLVKEPTNDTKSPDFVVADSSGTGKLPTDKFSISTTKSVSDVSGIGNGTFVKPYLDAKGTSVVGWHDDASVKANFYKFTLNFKATGGDKAVNLYFSGKSTITTTDTSNNLTIPSAARLSAVVGETQRLVYTPKGVAEHTYTDGKDGGATSNYIGALADLDSKKVGATLVFEQETPDLTANPNSTDNNCHGFLGSVTPKIGDVNGTDLVVTFYLWVEGTATKLGTSDDPNTIDTAKLTSDLQFYTI